MPADFLTAPERETVILMSDADGIATITTHQRRILTKLEGNPSAVKVEGLTHGSTAGAKFEIPARLVSLRNGTVQLSDEERKARADRMREVRKQAN